LLIIILFIFILLLDYIPITNGLSTAEVHLSPFLIYSNVCLANLVSLLVNLLMRPQGWLGADTDLGSSG